MSFYELVTFNTNASSSFFNDTITEQFVCFRINEKEEIEPYRVSKKWDQEYVVDLLLLSGEKFFHYVIITDQIGTDISWQKTSRMI